MASIPDKRVRVASSKVTAPENQATPQLQSHRQARDLAEKSVNEKKQRSAHITSDLSDLSLASQPSTSEPSTQPTTSSPPSPIPIDDDDDYDGTDVVHAGARDSPSSDGERINGKGRAAPSKKRSHQRKYGTRQSNTTDDESEATDAPPTKKRAMTHRVESDGIESESDGGAPTTQQTMQQRSIDVDAFFHRPEPGLNGKRRQQCQQCPTAKYLVCDISTLRRHIDSSHRQLYNRWCLKNEFESKLPSAVKARKEALKQTTLDGHVQDTVPEKKENVVPYSNALFRQAATEWLVATDQPIQAVDNPHFREMINIAARSKDGVKVPDRRAIRKHITDLFKANVADLSKRLNGPTVTGAVSLTCDAWQANNANAYFAVTGHWIEETSPGVWKLQNALLGFTAMNSAHDGVTLGRALFKIVRRLKISHKIGWVTCDNASNNTTMLHNFARRLNAHKSRVGMEKWDPRTRHIRCLAHIINLATQAFLQTYSKAPHYDPETPATHDPQDLEKDNRDVIGVVRAITVKARSSAKRSQLVRDLQARDGVSAPRALLLDMKVRWSSTFVMIERALSLKKYVNNFVYEMAREEDNRQKRAKLDALHVHDVEWTQLRCCIDLLKHADNAQQAFSSESNSTLHHGLPALEALYKAWSTRAEKVKYEDFRPALEDGLKKIDDYYNRTAVSPAYTIAMILDPAIKLSHFRKHWDKEAADKIEKDAQDIFKARYKAIYGNKPAPRRHQRSNASKIHALLDEDVSDDEGVPAATSVEGEVESEAWVHEWSSYINAVDEFGPHITNNVQWWGIHSARLPVWASLARDYLAIMASSVSSERAFSSAGITISKRRNRLKHDIVEALQFLKCSIRTELLFRERGPTSIFELENPDGVVDDDGDPDWSDEIEPSPWDLEIDDSDDED